MVLEAQVDFKVVGSVLALRFVIDDECKEDFCSRRRLLLHQNPKSVVLEADLTKIPVDLCPGTERPCWQSFAV
ncbi:hypothetical protein D3C75_566680 [compost metagenome]